jgi:hypothetical protein
MTYAVGVLSLPFGRLRTGGSPSAGSGTAVLYFLILFDFALAERKNEKIIIEKYHAAAGYKSR